MSFLVKTPNLPAAAADGVSQVSTYREAEVVPLGYGRDKFVSHWLCQPFNWKTTPAANKNQADNQICSIAAAYCAGPIHFAGKIWRDGKEIDNLDHAFADGDELFEVAVPRLGASCKMIIHRGTETAAISATLNAGTGQSHPPMRGLAWVEWVDLDLGSGTTTLPDLQVELGRKTPAIGAFGQSLFGWHGVNPFAAIYAILRDPVAFGLDAAYFDDAHWADQCAALESVGVAARTSIDTFCNPVFKSAQEAANLLSTILAHVDGYLYVDGGKFRIGWFPSQAPDGGLTEITEADLEAAPSNGSFPDWNRGPQSTLVIFRDFLRDYNDTPALCPAAANRETGVASTPSRADRPMIHDEDQAALIAAEISAAKASSESTITLTVKKSRAVTPGGAPLMPGDLMAWDYGPQSLDLIVRVVARRMRSGQTSDLLEIIPERGQFPLPYVPPVDARVLPTAAAPGIITVGDVRLWVLPSGFGALRQVAPLVNRAHRGIYRVDLHLSPTGAAPWENILDSRFFAAKATVTNGGVTNVAAVVRIISTSVDFARMAAQSTVAQTDDTLLLLVDNEVMSVGTITVVAANTYDLGILRARKGTTAAAHADAAVGFVFYRVELTAAQHAEFYRVRDGSNIYNAGIATKRFKFQLYTIGEDGLAKPDDPGISATLPDLSADDSAGYTIVLTNEAHTVACDVAGTVIAGQLGAGSLAKADVKVFRGATPLTAVNAGPNSDQYSFTGGTATGGTFTKEDNDTVRCDSMSADTATLEVVVTVAGAFTVAKIFTLTKVKTGATGAASTVPGPPGAASTVPGPTGNTVERRYTRSTLVPATPTGTSPAGWTTAIPSGTDALWVSEATKDSTGALVGSWSTPQRLTGNVIFYQNSAPAPGGYTLIDGDLWFDLDDGNRPYRWEDPGGGYAWVAKPFGDAAIANLAAGKITAGTIQAAISLGTLGSLTASSGANRFFADNNGTIIGAPTAEHIKLAANTSGYTAVQLFNNTTFKAQLGFISGVPHLVFQAGAGGKIEGADYIGTNTLKALSASDPRTVDAPLKTDGGAWIEKSLDVRGQTYLNNHLNLANGVNAYVGGDIYLGLGGVNRWLYDGDGNRLLQKRYATTPVTLADVIAVLQHHGLSV